MANQHYFDADPSVPSKERSIRLDLPDVSFVLTTDAGVFSGDRVDAGTKYLLLDAPEPAPLTATALDLGCGYGPIALTLGSRLPGATIVAVDVNERAVALTDRNARAAGLTNVRACLADEIDDTTRFDLIWSNPPIRIGKDALHELLSTWLGRLTPSGVAVLVVQKHLGADSLTAWLTANGWPTERIGSRKGYRLLDVRATV